MHELHATVFASLVPHNCDDCRTAARACDRSIGLDGDGRQTRGDDPSCVVSWPKCPGNYFALRMRGQEFLPLSMVVADIYDRGDHRKPTAPAGLVRLVSEWRRIRKAPGRLRDNKRLLDLKKEADR